MQLRRRIRIITHGFRLQDSLASSVHLSMAAGGSSENAQALAVGAHDPNRDGFTLQGLEIEAPLRLNDHLQGYAAWNLSWGGENEEWVQLQYSFGGEGDHSSHHHHGHGHDGRH